MSNMLNVFACEGIVADDIVLTQDEVKKVAKAINTSLNGRGGGRDTMIQGKVSADKKCITDFITNMDLGDFNG